MSWSISLVGSPARVIEALKAESDKQSGQCKIEYDDALPHLIGLVSQAFENRPDTQGKGVKLSASGSGYAKGPEQLERSISVTLETIYGFVGA